MSVTGGVRQAAPAATGAPKAAKATNVRWWILGIVIYTMAITTLNRLNLSIAGKYIEEEFSLSTITMGGIFSAFLWGYALFQIPWGWICDRYGPRHTLRASVLCFAVGAAAMGASQRLAALAGVSVLFAMRLIRFVTGVGEAAISSNVIRIIASWTATGERGFGSSLQVCGLGLGGVLTPVFIAWTMIHFGWRVAFYACSALAFLALLAWQFYGTDWPEQHPGVNSAELQQIRSGSTQRDLQTRITGAKTRVPWLKILKTFSVWPLILGYGLQGYAFYVYYNWFYFYAVKVRGLQLLPAAAWTSVPFLAIAVLSPLGGWLSDSVARRSTRRRGRVTAVWLGMGIAAVLLLMGSHIRVTSVALPLIALAAGFTMFATANFFAACIDLAPDFSASLSALMNTMGSVGGAISSTVTASVAIHYGWNRALDLTAVITLCSGLLFGFVNANRSIE